MSMNSGGVESIGNETNFNITFSSFFKGVSAMNRTSLTSLFRGWKKGPGKKLPALLAAGALAAMLNSCGDNVVETKGSGALYDATNKTASVSVYFRNGGGTGDISNEDVAVEFYGTSGSSYEVQSVDISKEPKGKYHEVTRGGIVFKEVPLGEYAVRVSKSGFATYYNDEIEVRQIESDNSGIFIPKATTVNALLYPLTGAVTGTAVYGLAKSKASGNADGATVTLTVNETKIEHRVFTAQVSNGKFSFSGLPAGPELGGAKLRAALGDYLSKDFDVALLPGVTTPIDGQLSLDYQPGVRLITPFVSVEATEAIELEFTDDIDDKSVTKSSVTVLSESGRKMSVNLSVSGNKITIEPAGGDWQRNNVKNEFEENTKVTISFSGVISKNNRQVSVNDEKGDPLVAKISTPINTLRVVNVGKDNTVWLSSISDDIVLEFNLDIEDEYLDGIDLISGSHAHNVSISGKTVTIVPATGVWDTASTQWKTQAAYVPAGPNNTPPAVPVVSFLDLADISAANGQTFNKNENTPLVKLADQTSPNFAIIKTGWFEDSLVITLADTGKTLEFELSDDIGTPISGSEFKASVRYVLTTGTVVRALELSATGKKLSVKPNPSWLSPNTKDFNAASPGFEVIFENIVSKSGKRLIGSVSTLGGPTGPTAATASTVVRGGKSFNIISSVVNLPAASINDTIDVRFTEPVDSSFIQGKVTVYTKRVGSSAPYTWTNVQLVSAKLKDNGRVVALFPLTGERWASEQIQIAFTTASDPNPLKSVDGVSLPNTGGIVEIAFGESKIDVSESSIAKVWFVERDDLRQSNEAKVDIGFVAARYGEKNLKIGDRDATNADGWGVGTYIIQGIDASGKPVSHHEVWLGQTGVREDKDTIFVSTWASFDEGSGSIGGKVISYRVTPKIGASLGKTAETPNATHAWITLAAANGTDPASTITSANWDSEEGEMEVVNTTNYGSTWGGGLVYNPANYTYNGASTAEQLAYALAKYDTWATPGATINQTILEKQSLFIIRFSDQINRDAATVTIDWRSSPNDIDVDVIKTTVYYDAITGLTHILGWYSGGNKNRDFRSEITDRGYDGSTEAKTYLVRRVELELTNLKSSGDNAPFGLIYERSRGNEIVQDFVFEIDGIYFRNLP